MSNPSSSHEILFKDKDGNWVGIPATSNDMYHTYLQYCIANNIEPVQPNVYYEAVGNLAAIVDSLEQQGSSLSELATLLKEGNIVNKLTQLEETMLKVTDISSGVNAPTVDTPGTYYFQHIK